MSVEMNQWVLLPVLLCVLSSGAVLGLDLQQVKEWKYDNNGGVTRYDIFCDEVLSNAFIVHTATVSQALDALCSSRPHSSEEENRPTGLTPALVNADDSQQPYFRDNALDAILAGRFGGGCHHHCPPPPPWCNPPATVGTNFKQNTLGLLVRWVVPHNHVTRHWHSCKH
jgi:hypothetical protein